MVCIIFYLRYNPGYWVGHLLSYSLKKHKKKDILHSHQKAHYFVLIPHLVRENYHTIWLTLQLSNIISLASYGLLVDGISLY